MLITMMSTTVDSWKDFVVYHILWPEGRGRFLLAPPMASETCNRKAVYLPQRGMDIKEKGPINVVASHLPKMSFIPTGKNSNKTQTAITNLRQC